MHILTSPNAYNSRIAAFTLVELSIVLVIIGLIVSGVLVGRDLIRAAELRAVISEAHAILTAVTTFRIKYNGLPGDMPNTSTFWPSCDTTASWCNGNGDGYIYRSMGAGAMHTNEAIRAWQLLALTGLYKGSFTGYQSVASQNDIGVNVPGSRYMGGGWFFDSASQNTLVNTLTNNVTIGKFLAANVNRDYILTPVDARSIDMKADDGAPLTGMVRGGHSDLDSAVYYWGLSAGFNGCALSATNTYNTTPPNDNTPLCVLQFMF